MGRLELRTTTPEQTGEVAALVAAQLEPGDVLALIGDLGAGKTTFVQCLARALGVSGYVRSPSFILIHEHRGTLPLYHIDAFRLGGADELHEIGVGEYLDGDGVTAVEWADRVSEVLPEEYLEIKFILIVEDGSRRLLFHGRGPRYQQMVEELKRFGRTGY